MSDTVISVEHLYKQYRLGKVGTGSFAHDLNRWWHTVRGKEDPYLKIGEVNDRTVKGNSDYVWALQDINFEVKQGEVLGIIGKNGAGKSTLLKVLSRTTSPTSGQLKIKGRIASLLEVGTGFHPELTGRENIFLNGAILGMTRHEIRSKFDEIVAFSGVEKYIDTPVKRYSSGMYVRLAFAVAAHLDPEILIVDEVLAVGDMEFQKKALGRMKEVSKNDGRTVLFVSHNMGALKSLCSRALLLANGTVVAEGETSEMVNMYLEKVAIKNYDESNGVVSWNDSEAPGKDELRLVEVSLRSLDKKVKGIFRSDEPIFCSVRYKLKSSVRNFRLNLQVRTSDDNILFTATTHSIESVDKAVGEYLVTYEIPPFLFNQGIFNIYLQADIPTIKTFGLGNNYISFYVQLNHKHGTVANEVLNGYLSPIINIHYEKP